MKNQYVGDIGDYTKLALLRVIENAGFSIGVNWYLTPDDKDSKDGRHIEYLNSTRHVTRQIKFCMILFTKL